MISKTENLSERINTRMNDLLFQNTPLSTGIALINALIIYLILFQSVENSLLLIWMQTILIASFFRVFITSMYWKRRTESQTAGKLMPAYLLFTYISAITWGVLILVIPERVLWMESVTAFVIAAMSASTLTTNSARLDATVPYMILILIFLPYHFVNQGEPPYIARAIMITLYMFLMIRLSFRIHEIQYHVIRSELENNDLYKILKRAKDDTDTVREDLKEKMESLPQELAHLDIFFDLSPDMLFITDTDGRLVLANRAILQATSMDENDYKSRSLFSYLRDDDTGGLNARLENLRKDQDEERCSLHLKYSENDYRLTDFHIVYDDGYFYFAGREAAAP